MDFNKFYTDITKKRNVSWISELVYTGENAIQLGEGITSMEILPIEEITFRLKKTGHCRFTDEEFQEAFRMGVAQGSKCLVERLRKMQKTYHNPSRDDWDVILTNGAQEGLTKSIEAFLQTGDPILIQSPCYYGITGILTPLLPEILEIEQDEHGVIPDQIFKLCSERLRDKKRMPKLLYLNPTGANPTGTVLPNSRRREIYKLAQKFDFLILEDDPYFFIDFSINKPVSFFEIDTDGRVIRLDSFSKIMSAGIRLGVVTAHKNFIEKLTAHVESSCMHASSLSQMMVYKLLETWGLEKFGEHVQDVKEFYRIRRDVMVAAVEKHLTGLAEWAVPQGGMFVWIKVLHLKDVMTLATEKCVPEGVLILPGHAFSFDRTKPNPYIRLCYSYATPDEIEKAMSILAQVIRKEVNLNNGN